MTSHPAVHVSDEFSQLLEREAVYQSSFFELTGAEHPWEITYPAMQSARERFREAEASLRLAHNGAEITCVLSGRGAFWLPRRGLERYLNELDTPIRQLNEVGPPPVWKMTAGELYANHISNLRRLILAAPHDLALLAEVRGSLGGNGDYLQNEFARSEKKVRALVDEIRNQGPALAGMMRDHIALYERATITERMIALGEVAMEDLGYSMEDLREAHRILEDRCRKTLPAFKQRLQAAQNLIRDAMREGESAQLTRSSRWDLAFASMGRPPDHLGGMARLSEREREMYGAVVSSRESELGESESGRSALDGSRACEEARHPERVSLSAPPAGPEPGAEPKTEGESQPRMKSARRMAHFSFGKKRGRP